MKLFLVTYPTADDAGAVYDVLWERDLEVADIVAQDAARKRGFECAMAVEEFAVEWFGYDEIRADIRNDRYSVPEHFRRGGAIGAEIDGLEIMIVPSWLEKERDVADGEWTRTVYGSALMRVRDRPDLELGLELEGLDEVDQHLMDKLSSEMILTVGRARSAEVATSPKA